ncbi:MAG: cysteine--tRNA ligase [Acidimicrobiaceae bacterium]|nr:cysteine--tRNA ligase [Acidimicrobiaceae bacterium]MDP6285130.1 cysteine--tRNA ligase [Acidimicrobiales bacterium]
MSMRLYDTSQGAVVPFEPGDTVSIYVCGVTPYDATHLGHAFTYLCFDVLIRRLEDLGHEVKMVRNITDVDDSILAKAKEIDVDYMELGLSETAQFRDDIKALGLRPAVAEPTVTGSIDEIVSLISQLAEKGHTYTVDGSTFFDVTTFSDFGQISGYDEPTMISFANERGANTEDERLRNPLDFILWQKSEEGEPSWDSPFGPGRPGWHIECSAMAMSELGPTIDLHGGGDDLIFPHHECETAQSVAANNSPFARHWMHIGMVAYEGEKMSKSLGNLVFVRDLRTGHDPRAIRLALLSNHYRAGFEWFDSDIDKGEAMLERMIEAASCPSGPDSETLLTQVREAIDDDLNLPKACEIIDDFAVKTIEGSGNDSDAKTALTKAAELLGVDLNSV